MLESRSKPTLKERFKNTFCYKEPLFFCCMMIFFLLAIGALTLCSFWIFADIVPFYPIVGASNKTCYLTFFQYWPFKRSQNSGYAYRPYDC